jgi:DNA-binding NarL/FixJ family response regulator
MMTVSSLNLFLVDEDPVFRLGLRIWLDQRPEFNVIGEASSSETALASLENLQSAAITSGTDASSFAESPVVDLVILDLGLGQGTPDQMPGLPLCGAIKQQYPDLAVLVLSAYGDPVLREAAKQMGADGFGQRGLPVNDLARLILHTAYRQTEQTTDITADVSFPERPEGPVAYLNRTSLEQIDQAMAEIEQAASQPLPYWYQLVLAGKYRELRAARWLVQRLLPVPETAEETDALQGTATGRSPVSRRKISATPAGSSSLPASQSPTTAQNGAIARRAMPMPVPVGDVRSRVAEAVFRKLQFPLDNRSDIPLEIDILRSDKARELLYTTLRSFETLLEDLQQAEVLPGQLAEKTPLLLHDLWETVTVDFFGRYYTPAADGLEQPMVEVLKQDAEIVQGEILDRIPAVPTLLAHLLFQASLEIDGASYLATTPEALRRSQFLLENLLIQVACAVMQPLLNRYPDVESLKRNLYQRRIISTRDITRFRNELSWRYRLDALVNEPKAIFESEYRLFALTPEGIRPHTIYAPRREELEALSGVQYAVTLALEARDAIAPRLRATISLVGSSVVFVLTEVIGRGIGLIGRGIVKGVGSTWQEIRFRQRQRDEM